jgi:hypothetical protein
VPPAMQVSHCSVVHGYDSSSMPVVDCEIDMCILLLMKLCLLASYPLQVMTGMGMQCR